MRERRPPRTASIPSKHRGRTAGNEMRESLVVKRLDGVVSPESSETTSALNGVVLPNGEAMSRINSSRLKSDLKRNLTNMEYDQRSLELLVRLIKSGPFARDVINDENRQPPPSPTSVFDHHNGVDIDNESESTNYASDYVITNTSPRFKPRPVTLDPSARFRKSIQELKSARERFGVCMSVNGTIAKVRNVQQRNVKSRKEGREKLPALNGSSSGESSDSERHVSPRNYGIIAPIGPWLALSGRKIQLKHQGHVERVLGQPEESIQPHRDVLSRDKRKRSAKSAPPRASVKAIPIRKFAWSDGNKFVVQRVSQSFRNIRSPINFSASFHGFQSPPPIFEKLDPAPEIPVENPTTNPGTSIANVTEKRIVSVTDTPPKPIVHPPTPPLSCHSNDSVSIFSTMPRPVRSVVIKLPDTGAVTSPSTSLPNMTSANTASPRPTNVLPSRPTVKLEALKHPG